MSQELEIKMRHNWRQERDRRQEEPIKIQFVVSWFDATECKGWGVEHREIWFRFCNPTRPASASMLLVHKIRVS